MDGRGTGWTDFQPSIPYRQDEQDEQDEPGQMRCRTCRRRVLTWRGGLIARQTVLELLDPPLQRHHIDWSGGIESLSFSQPKWNADYESVVVWIGSDGNVTWHGRAVTD